ncbi:tetratricopeptide repeat protein [Arsukibacterium indicum]|uniref:Tetratricopeptide repeat protein n=1 Tax=Arsukibacterium indicum TaxID=2848612 RepID=A0ABS6MJW3_9GAMM|nr:tetratricopeptide repeat protein [Arsukibacterium indicum]MBV2129040.1 tetratricopeptide repeat protein [Arsukibacterium indicum]
MRMPRTILLCGLVCYSLLCSQNALATGLVERLKSASEDHELVITTLLASEAPRHYSDWLVLAQAYLSADNKDAALQALQQASELAVNNHQHAHVALLRAKVYGILFRDTRHAISYLQQAETLLHDSEGAEQQQLYSDVLTNFAQAYNQLGDLARAEHFASQSLQLALKLTDPTKELAARIMLGRLALQNNRFSQAHQHLRQAMLLADQLNDTDALASVHFRLGMAYRKIAEHDLALDHMQQAATLYQRLNNLSSYSYALVYIAESYLEKPEGIAQAEQYLLDALAISTQINNVMRTAIVKQSLGRASMLKGDNQQAAQYYNAALQQFRQIGAQTYVQESALAFAELLFLQQQYNETQQILAELNPTIDNAANYLQARYYDLRARLAEQHQDWQAAYLLQQQASQLQFTELTATTTEKLNELKHHLSQSNARHDNEAQWLSQQRAIQITLRYWQLSAAILALLLTLSIFLYFRQRRHSPDKLPVQMPVLLSHSWNRFCERLQQDGKNKQPLHFLAFAIDNNQQLKLDKGEETLRQPLQIALNKLSDPQISGYCIDNDVLWLGYRAGADETARFARQLEYGIQQAMAPLLGDSRLISLQLDITQLLGAQWQTQDLTALREALWLSWKLASLADDHSRCWQLQLKAEQSRPCEWRSSNIRHDMISALQLGTLILSLNQEALPATLSALLVAGAADISES